MLIYSRAEMSYTVEYTKKADGYETLDIEHFQPLSELEKTPDTSHTTKKVHSKLVLLSKRKEHLEGWVRNYTKYQISFFQEKGVEEDGFKLWQGYDHYEAQKAFGTIKCTLNPLLDGATNLLQKHLLKKIVLPTPLKPEDIPPYLIEDNEPRKENEDDLNESGEEDVDAGINIFHHLNKENWTKNKPRVTEDKTKTKLMVAIEKHDIQSALNLVFSHVNTNEKHPPSGDTALHTAVRLGKLMLVRLLLAYQADPTIPNANGETPINAAEKLPDSGKREEIKTALKAIQDRREKARSFYQQNSKLPEKKNSSDVFLLSLDGGGMRAVIICHILAAIENRMKELCSSSAKPLRSYFDYFAGTSSGAIVGACLLYGNLQFKFAGKHLYKFMSDVFCCSMLDRSNQLKRYITDKVGEDTVMSDLQDGKFIVTSTIANVSPNKLHLMTSYGEARDGQKGPKERKVWEALAASAAAPTYFPAFGDFLDGGLMANNPTLPVMAEIFNQAKKDNEEVKIGCVLSLGTGYSRYPQKVNDFEVFVPGITLDIFKKLAISSKGILNLLSHFVEQTTQSDGECVCQAKSWCQSIGAEYFRFSLPFNVAVAPDIKKTKKFVSLLYEAELYILEEYEKIDQAAKVILSK